MKIIVATPIDNSDFVAEVSTYMGGASLHQFAIGFLEVAEIAAERSVQNRCAIDAVIPATLYSLRHSLELYLKYVIYHLRVVDEIIALNGHDVLKTYEKHKESVLLALECERADGFQYRDWFARLETVVKAVNELDTDGQAVRYPADQKLVPNQKSRYIISTKHLAACLATMRELYREFEERNC